MLRYLFRMLNSILSKVGFKLDLLSEDFDSRLQSEDDVAEMIARLAKAFDDWVAGQNTFDGLAAFDSQAAIKAFYHEYLASPFRSKFGGSRFNNLLFLHLIAKGLQPELIIDSGSYQGASAWALSSGAPNARTVSFDIDLSRLIRRHPRVEYVEKDWSDFDFEDANFAKALCYFDDHLDQIMRLLQADKLGVPYAIFDDDFPITSFAPMADGGRSLPKIEFALDPYVRGKKEIKWVANGKLNSWMVDESYLEAGRAVIRETQRLPNTSSITGIHQTPYRIVALEVN